jgi:hypothetical protein
VAPSNSKKHIDDEEAKPSQPPPKKSPVARGVSKEESLTRLSAIKALRKSNETHLKRLDELVEKRIAGMKKKPH